MGFFDWLAAPFKSKSSLGTEAFLAALGGNESFSGVSVTPESAMRAAAVYACVAVLSESIAQLPLVLYRRNGNSKERATAHPLYTLLHDSPNRWQSAFEFRQMLQTQCLLRGFGLAFVNRGPERVYELIPIQPDFAHIRQDPKTYELTVEVQNAAGRIVLTQGEVFILRGMTLDGITGVSPIKYARETIGLSLAAERHGSRLFGNGARPGGVLEAPGAIKKEEMDQLRLQWHEAQGGENAHKVAVLTGGMTFKPITISNDDAQYLETRRLQRSEIASIFRVPAHLINDLERATFSNVEHLGLSFVVHSLMPWLVRWEQAISRDLLAETERQIYFPKHVAAGLLRGDVKSRYEAYAQGINSGWLTRNEVRDLEDLNPIDGLNEPLVPLNMGGVTQGGTDAAATATP